MKKIIVFFISTCLLLSTNAFANDGDRSLLEKLLNRDLPGGAKSTINQKRKSVMEKNKLKKRDEQIDLYVQIIKEKNEKIAELKTENTPLK